MKLRALGYFALIFAAIVGFALFAPTTAYASEATPQLFRFGVGEGDARRYGFEDADGNVVIAATFRNVHSFSDGFAPVRGSEGWGFINITGDVVVPMIYNAVWPFSEGLARVNVREQVTRPRAGGGTTTTTESRYGFVNTAGGVAVPLSFNGAMDFSDGRAAVRVGEPNDRRWGFINASGSMVIPATFLDVWSFSRGYAQVRDSSGWGLIDRDGNIRVPLRYDRVESFSGGFARVQLNGKWGFVNETGHEAIPLVYDTADDFIGGLAMVGRGQNWDFDYGLINTGGEIIVPLEFTSGEIGMIRRLMLIPADNIPSNVQLLHWDEVRGILPLRQPVQIFDVQTGITFELLSMSNGLHADVEPVTAADTARLYEAFGGWTWSGRPVWVTIGDRTIAAALHSMPHASTTVPGNDMDGHICLHFYGSTTHNTREPVYHYQILYAREAYDFVRDIVPNLPAIPGVAVTPTIANVIVDGQRIEIPAYSIGGSNHFRIRDVAQAFSGTSVQFGVGGWGGTTLIPGGEYYPVGGELSIVQTGRVWARPTGVWLGGWAWGSGASVPAYSVGGINYFRLADLGEQLGFNARWSQEEVATVVTAN